MTSLQHSAHLAVNSGQGIICQGWVLKKRRKKMQGFARRYFVLHQSGVLSYSVDPKRPARDQISLPHAAISTAVGRKDIHIDTSKVTFHIKCLSTDDFNTWMSAFRKFISSDGRISSFGKTTPRLSHSQWNRSGGIAEDMGSSIAELESAIALLQTEDTSKKNHASLKSRGDKDKHKDHHKDGGSVFGLFKKSGANHDDNPGQRQSPESPLYLHFRRIHVALDSLKAQHAALLQSLNPVLQNDTVPPTARGSPLPPTTEEQEEEAAPQSRFSTPFTRKSKRTASLTSLSDSGPIEWFDAEDAGEEFFLEDATPEEEKGRPILTPDSRSSLHESESSEESHEVQEMLNNGPDPSLKAIQVVRRNRLPSGPVGDEGSLFAILKKNVGKDLSTIAFPVSFNEPLTLLQRTAEELEYHTLLQQATDASDPIERMCYVAAFAVSGYAHTKHRSGRKGFNPMLGETFEDVRMKLVVEKVQHNPVIMAYHAEGEGWELSASSAGKTKFWGKSLEIINYGTSRLKIGDDRYTWNKPSSFMRNLMMGTKYLEHCGKMTIDNHVSGASCVLEFKQSGYWGASNEVSGTVLSATGDVCARIEGKWDDHLAQVLDSSHLRVLWRITPFPKESLEFYGFTSFGITLNEITSDLDGRLPPTDSRYRPDVRALEEGDIEEAEQQKARLEDMQRERRKRGADRKPRWFKQSGEDWVYTGGYWEARATGWKNDPIEPLW